MIRLAPIPAGLPATVPFVGPETLERRAGRPFVARLGANENGFGTSSPLSVRYASFGGAGAALSSCTASASTWAQSCRMSSSARGSSREMNSIFASLSIGSARSASVPSSAIATVRLASEGEMPEPKRGQG